MNTTNTPFPAGSLPARHPLARAVALALALGAGSVQGATITVDSAADPAAPMDDGNCTLREAIQAANSNASVDACAPGASGLDTLQFSDGLGTVTLTAGQIDITETLSITGPATGQTISGGGNSRIFGVTAAGTALSLENLNLTGGHTSANDGFPITCADGGGAGGAVCALGDLTLTNSTVSDSSTAGSSASGGGLFVADGDLTLTNSTLSGNSTAGTNADGGGIHVVYGNVTLTNSTLSANSTAGDLADGGGLFGFGANVTLTSSTLSGNGTTGDGGRGGGLFVYGGNVALTDSTVSGNSTVGINATGGGLDVERGDLTLTNSTVSGNSTAEYGGRGGGLNVRYGNVTLTNSTVSGNSTAGFYAPGGGLCVGGNSGNVTLSNSTVSGNSTTGGLGGGGGLYLVGFAYPLSDVTLSNSTVSGNSASAGGGLFVNANTFVLSNSTVSGNSATEDLGGGLFAQSSDTSLISTILAANSGPGGNVVVDTGVTLNTSFSLFGDDPSEINGTNANNVFDNDPGLATLADNGCAVPAGAPGAAACVRTHALLPGSPAVDAGSNPLDLETDQRGAGFPRVLDTTADIGAFEGLAPPTSVAAAVLPNSRSVQVGVMATAFATIVNTGGEGGFNCGIAPADGPAATFVYQTTDALTNELTGTADTPVDIAAGQRQSYVIAFTPTAAFAPIDIELDFSCGNSNPAPRTTGLNTLLLSASDDPVPDIVALGATPSMDGIARIPGSTGTGVFSVATVNVGIGAQISVSADTGGASLPIGIMQCETDPLNGSCINPTVPTPDPVITTIGAGETPTFGFFVMASGEVPFDPANNRIFVRFKDGGEVTRGATSVAATTAPEQE